MAEPPRLRVDPDERLRPAMPRGRSRRAQRVPHGKRPRRRLLGRAVKLGVLLGLWAVIIASFGDLFGRPLTLKEMSPFLPKAVIATEDRRFYHHFGIDPFGLARAAVTDLRAGQIVQGGSTITQQLAKILFLSPERNLARKIRETMLT